MKKAISILFLAILAVTLLSATRPKAKEFIPLIMGGDIDDIKKLIDAGADVNDKFDFGATRDITALVFAVILGQAEICRVLIDAGADVNIISSGGMTLLHQVALSSGDYKETAELLIAKGLDVNAKHTSFGETKDATPLHVAAGKGNVSIAELLIQNGAEVNARLPFNGYTSLHLASRDGNIKMAELLIAQGAEIDAKSKYGETPLDLAMSKEHKELVDLLRKHGGHSGKN